MQKRLAMSLMFCDRLKPYKGRGGVRESWEIIGTQPCQTMFYGDSQEKFIRGSVTHHVRNVFLARYSGGNVRALI